MRASTKFGGGGGINFSNPKYFLPYCVTATSINIVDSANTPANSTATAFFTELARRGLQDQSNWTADTYKVLLDITSGSGEVAAIIGCTAGGAETTTFEITVDNKLYTVTVAGLASGERALLTRQYNYYQDDTTESAAFYVGAEALDTDKATFSGGIASGHMPNWRRSWHIPKLEFKTSLKIRAKHSVSITNSTATAYSGVMYRKFLEA